MTKLEVLSREEKIRRLEVLREKKRRAKEKRPGYAPNEMQAATHLSDKEVIINLSGNGSGKTASLAHEAWWGAEGYHPYLKRYFKLPGNVTVVLDHPDKVGDKWVPELKKWFPLTDDMCHKNGKPYITSINVGVSEINFMFFEQPEMAFESIEGEVFIFDEPPPRKIFNALTRGGREKGTRRRIVMAGTPIGQSWIRREFLVPWSKGEMPDVECLRFDADVNKDNVNWEAQEKYFARLTEKEKLTRRHGHFFDLDGLALAGIFDRSVHIVKSIDWDPSWPCVVAIDPHPSKSHHAVILGCNAHNELFILKETAQKMVPREFARHLKTWMEGYRLIDIVVDSLGSGEGTGGEGFKTFIQVLNSEGIRCRATTYDEKSDEDFVTRIQSALEMPEEADNFGRRSPKLRILAQCTGIVYDIENAEWQRDRAHDMNRPKLEISNRDFLSCVKYALATGLFFKKADLSAIQRPIPTTYGVRPGVNTTKKRVSMKEWLKD